MIGPEFAVQLAKWSVLPDGVPMDTPSSWVLFVGHGTASAVLKVYKTASDERHGADFLKYLGGDGAVRVMEADDTALLMERAVGSRSLMEMAVNGEDIQSAEILADTILRLHAPRSSAIPKTLVPLETQFMSLFKRANDHPLLRTCASLAHRLLERQSDIVPLHGDLHHSNVLDGGARGWLAIDPKALIGERTYEVANLLGNPWPHGEIVHDTVRIQKLAELYATRLRLNADRILAYALAHAGLSASWDLDDGFDPGYRLKCIEVLTPLVGR
jgi:streptomycin 6-kinase